MEDVRDIVEQEDRIWKDMMNKAAENPPKSLVEICSEPLRPSIIYLPKDVFNDFLNDATLTGRIQCETPNTSNISEGIDTMSHFRIQNLVEELVQDVEYRDTRYAALVRCSAELICDDCQKEKTIIRWSMPPPGYVSKSGFAYYGDNQDLCIWYDGIPDDKGWWKNSDFLNLCPECRKKNQVDSSSFQSINGSFRKLLEERHCH